MNFGVLLSGGIDSSSLVFWKRPSICFTVDYGQLPASAEIKASHAITTRLGIHHEIIRVDCSSLGSGDLTRKPTLSISNTPEWWPYRNQLLITLCAMRAIEIGIKELLLGTVRSDTVHRDGTPEFYSLLDQTLACQEGGLRVSAPALTMSSGELIATAKLPIDLLLMTHSCHTGSLPCGRCRGCQRRFATFQALELEDKS